MEWLEEIALNWSLGYAAKLYGTVYQEWNRWTKRSLTKLTEFQSSIQLVSTSTCGNYPDICKWGSKTSWWFLRIIPTWPCKLHWERHVKLKDLLYSPVLKREAWRVQRATQNHPKPNVHSRQENRRASAFIGSHERGSSELTRNILIG